MKNTSSPKSKLSQAFDEWLKSQEAKSILQDSADNMSDLISCHCARMVSRAFLAGARQQTKILMEHIPLN
jgi:hypothetical protein